MKNSKLEKKVPVSEIFFSLQGEGVFTGQPSVFIRVFGCNLRCKFCDTLYSVVHNREKRKANVKFYTAKELYDEYRKYNCEHVVVTGGEPMLYDEVLSEFISICRNESSNKFTPFVTIETNGTIFKESVKPDMFSISPKITKNILHTGKDLSAEQIKDNLINNDKNTYDYLPDFYNLVSPVHEVLCLFKFVATCEQDFKDILDICKKKNINKDFVYVMPEGKTKNEQTNNAPVVAELCKKYMLKFCFRMHIYLWGSKRGV